MKRYVESTWIIISLPPLDAEKSNEWKPVQKMGFAWVKDISYMQWVISGIKHLSIWVSPTQFQKLSNNFKIEFPANRTKNLISPESEWFTESVPNFWNEKFAQGKKFCRFLIPEFNLSISLKIFDLVKLRLIISRLCDFRSNVQIPPKVEMWAASQMCCIHIWTVKLDLYSSFKHQQRTTT